MAKSKRELLEVIAKLRGMAVSAIYEPYDSLDQKDEIAKLNTEEYGAGLPHFKDELVNWEEWE
jgi:hypothetical protein